MIIVIKIKLSKLGTNHSPKRKSEVDIMEKRSAFESLNTVKQGVKPDQTIICLLDCGNDDYRDKCDGICKPTAS